MYRVLLVDDQPIFRDIMRGVLQRSGMFEFVGEAEDGGEAVAMYALSRPDLVIMDVQMPTMNGFEATRRILDDYPDATVLLTSMGDDPNYGRAASEAGAVGFVQKRNLDIENVFAALGENYDVDAQQAA